MRTYKVWGILGQGLAIATLTTVLAGCGGSTGSSGSDASAATASPTASTPVANVPAGAAITSGTSTVTSADGTLVPSASRIVDRAHNVWTVSNGVISENGQAAGYSANVNLLAYVGGTIYQQNKSCLWWSWNGSAWVSTSNPAPSAVPACSSTAAAATPASTTSTTSSTTSSTSGSAGNAGTSTSSSSSSTSSSSSNSGAHGTTAALLAYMQSLQGQTKHILSGQHSSYWSGNPLDVVQAATNQTGKTVAILGLTTGQSGSNQNLPGSVCNGSSSVDAEALANSWLAKGGIVMMSWWPADPLTGSCQEGSPMDAATFASFTQPGSTAYVKWHQYLDLQIAALKRINGPVLYRPLVEMDGTWSWWDHQDPTVMKTLWQQMHDYFAQQGVTNVLWVYNVNYYSGNYTQYYAGDAYVDIASWDAYPPVPGDPTYAALVSLNKPIIMAEVGVNSPVNSGSGDNGQLLQTVKQNFPKVVGVVVFCQGWALSVQAGAANFMNDSATISLSDLPSGLVDP